jgi:hypothetical protein
MPRHDERGPEGRGPGTGWGYGPCGKFEAPPHEEILKKLEQVLDKLSKLEDEVRQLK